MKFLTFIAIVVTLWYVTRWIQQAEITRRARQQRTEGTRKPPHYVRASDTILCARCGTYVPADFPTACARTDCPFPGVG